MDFRDVCIDRIKFNKPVRRGASLASKASYGAGKITFQMPICYARFTSAPKFPGAVDIMLNISGLRDIGALAFIAQLRDRAEGDDVLACHIDDKNFFDPLRKLTAFDETPMFDSSGDVIETTGNLVDATHEISLLVNVDGAWISDRSWGLRIRISQVKIHRQRVTPPPVKLSFPTSDKPTGPRQGFMFRDEDDTVAGASKFAFLDD
jgi:hypothetical protein